MSGKEAERLGYVLKYSENVKQLEELKITPYDKLIRQINMFHEDDGIRFNKKLKAVMEVWKESCKTKADVEESVSCVYQQCLINDSIVSKVVTMFTAYSFASQMICDTKLRNKFISLMQSHYETRETLRLQNVNSFRRSVKVLGGFFNKARFMYGTRLHILAEPLMDYLELLLKYAEPEDLELFTNQLYINGATLKAALPERFKIILTRVRNLLITKSDATVQCKTWLLLAVEASNYCFGVLPSDLHKFYQDKLGDEAMAYIRSDVQVTTM